MKAPERLRSINCEEIATLAQKALTGNGINEKNAAAIVRAYLEAEKCQKRSHGLKLIPWILEQLKDIDPGAPTVISQTPCSIFIDGAANPGPPVAELLVDELLDLTEKTEIAVGGIRNAGHIGMLAYYAQMFCRKKRIVLIFATTPSVTVPVNGKLPVLGTNPLCIGVPTRNDPIILDMGTTAITYHALLNARTKGHELPDNVVLDREGNPTINPETADPARLLTFGGYKGFGISLMIEILSGALTGWQIGTQKAREIKNDRFATTMIVIRADAFVDEKVFIERVESLKKDIAESQENAIPRLPYSEAVSVKKMHEKSGTIDIPVDLLETLKSLTERSSSDISPSN